MTRRPFRFDPLRSGHRPIPTYPDAYHCEWGLVVGDRIRRLRQGRGMTLKELGEAVARPDGGGHYSPGFFSRLERGWSSGPLVTYVNVADVFGVQPGRLLGPDDVQREVTEAEMTLIRLLRQMGTPPHEAIMRVAVLAA